MKKIYKALLIAVILMATTAMVFAAGSAESSKTLLEEIKEQGRITVGTEAQYAPYEFRDSNNNVVGCDIFLAEQIAESLGVELEIVDMAFDGIIPAIQSGQVDLGIAAFTNTPERAEVIDFSDIYEESLQHLVVKTENVGVYTSAESLAGKMVGAQRGTIQSQLILNAFPDSTLFELARYPELSLEVRNGNIAGLVADAAVAEAIVAASDGTLAIANYVFDSEVANFGKSVIIQKGHPELVEEVNKVIARVLADGSYVRARDEAEALQKSLGL